VRKGGWNRKMPQGRKQIQQGLALFMKMRCTSLLTAICPSDNVERILNINDVMRRKCPIFLKRLATVRTVQGCDKEMRKP
jgi:hypothetical protein